MERYVVKVQRWSQMSDTLKSRVRRTMQVFEQEPPTTSDMADGITWDTYYKSGMFFTTSLDTAGKVADSVAAILPQVIDCGTPVWYCVVTDAHTNLMVYNTQGLRYAL